MASSETDKDAKDDCGKSDISEKSQDSTSRDSSTRQPPKTKHRVHQIRPGIEFKVGARLEARDYMDKWYLSRVVDVDEDKGEVLIHFERWSSRFDEWVDMKSPQLRPLTRTSARKDPPKEVFHPDHKIGEQVLARWSDCKMYPGKVMSINSNNGTYDVLFYDGVRKTLTPHSLKKMSPEALEKSVRKYLALSSATKNLTPPPTPTGDRKKIKRKLSDGNEPASKPAKMAKYASPSTSSSTKDAQSTKSKTAQSKSDAKKYKLNTSSKPKKRKLLLIGGSFQAKRNRLDEKDVKRRRKPFNIGRLKSKPEKMPVKFMKRKYETKYLLASKNILNKPEKLLTKDSNKESKTVIKDVKTATKEVKTGTKDIKSLLKDVVTAKDNKMGIKETNKEKNPIKECAAANKEFKLKDSNVGKDKNTKEIMVNKDIDTSTIEESESTSLLPGESNLELTDEGETTTKSPTAPSPPPPALPEQCGTDPDTPSEVAAAPESTLATPSTPAEPSALMQILTSPAANAHPPKANPLAVKKLKPVSKGVTHIFKNLLQIDLDHNQFKCQVEGCGKGFRKEGLLQSHIRHYHSSSSRVDPVPHVKRKKRIVTSDLDSPTPLKPLSLIAISPIVATSASMVMTSTPVKPKKKPPPPPPYVAPEPEVPLPPVDTKELEKVILVMEPVESFDQKPDLGHDESTMDTILTNDDIGDELRREEIVNCVCRLNEENGFMMQCEICLCWQHGGCFNIQNEESLPNKYFCYICQNPPGLRESFRYKHDHEWWRDGAMTTFGFLPKKKTNRNQQMLTLHNMVAETHNINTVLHGLRLKLDIAKNSKHSNLKMWAKPWNDAREKRPNGEDGNTSADDSIYDNTDSTLEVESSDVEIMDMKDRVVPPHLPHFDHMYSGRLPPSTTPVTPPPSITVEDVKPHLDLAESKTTVKTNLGLMEIKEECVSEDDDEYNRTVKEEPSSQEYTNSPVPTNVKLTGSSIWTPVVKQKVVVETISQEEQYQICETNLLDHIMDLQDELSYRLDIMEDKIGGLESEWEQQPSSSVDSMADLSQVKKSLRLLLSDLGKVKRLAQFH